MKTIDFPYALLSVLAFIGLGIAIYSSAFLWTMLLLVLAVNFLLLALGPLTTR